MYPSVVMPIPILVRQRQEGLCKFKASLSYVFRLANKTNQSISVLERCRASRDMGMMCCGMCLEEGVRVPPSAVS